MAEPLKNIYTKAFFTPIIDLFEQQSDHFNRSDFINKIFNEEWENMELKERYSHIASTLHIFLPESFPQSIDILLKQLSTLAQKGVKVGSYEYLFYPDYIEQYGLNDWETSSFAMKEMTKYISCEFTIRPFLKENPKRTFAWLYKLSKDKHPNVRRFSSEACRPKLPWGGNIKFLESDPSPIFPIMETLISDDSLFVRKSVANNLNDISKTHPEMLINFCKKWKNGHPHSEWIIKHACRSLLKAGHPEVMQMFNYASIDNYNIEVFKIENTEVQFGESIHFNIEIKNTSKLTTITRLEYGIYFLKSNGKKNRKVFKISEFELKPNQLWKTTKQHKFIDLTTRKHYDGEHELSLIVNGIEVRKQKFRLNLN